MSTILPKISAANTWVNCPGSHKLSRQFINPRENTEAMLRGRKEHSDASAFIISGTIPNDNHHIGSYVKDVLYNSKKSDEMQVEKKLPIRTDNGELHAVPDAFCIFHSNRTVVVWEYKSGYLPVASYNNWQLYGYAVAIVERYPVTSSYMFEFRVVQPRIRSTPYVSTSFYTVEWKHVINKSVVDAMKDTPRCLSGTWCHHCSALSHCHTGNAAGKIAISYSEYSIIDERTPQLLASDYEQLRAAEKFIRKLADAIEIRLENEIRSGKTVVGYELGPGREKVEWSMPIEDVLYLGELYNVEIGKMGAMTPKQAIKAGIPEVVVMAYAKTVKTKEVLRKTNDDEYIKMLKEAK
jgi:hypothetical protein